MDGIERYDVLGGLLEMVVIPTGRVILTVTDRGEQAAHVLEGSDDAVGIAHWLIRQAVKLGDMRPEVLTALGALALLQDREEAQAESGARMMGDQ